MPEGKCEICGCTEFRACEFGCRWINAGRNLCSQCVGWVLLRLPNAFAGIMPYDLWPTRRTEPEHTRRLGTVWQVDVRRMNAEQLERTAHVVAPMLGFTVDDFMAEVATGKEPFVIRGKNVEIATRARCADEAADFIEEWRRTGKFTRGLAVSVFNTKGDQPHG